MIKLLIIILILYILVNTLKPSRHKKVQANYGNPYSILGIQPTASIDEIKDAFREQSKKNHPDLVTHMAPDFQKLAEEKLKKINWAYAEIRKKRGF